MTMPHYCFYLYHDGVPFLAGGLVGPGCCDLDELDTYKFFEYIRIKQIQCDFIRLLDSVNQAHVHLLYNCYEDLAARLDFLEVTRDEFPEPITHGANARWIGSELDRLEEELTEDDPPLRDGNTEVDLPPLLERIETLRESLATFIDT